MTDGLRVSPTQGGEYKRILFEEFTPSNDVEPTRLFSPSIDIGSVSIRCPDTNQGAVYIGWDEDVTTENGYPLYARDGLGVDLNVRSQPIYAVADTAADEVRIISTN